MLPVLKSFPRVKLSKANVKRYHYTLLHGLFVCQCIVFSYAMVTCEINYFCLCRRPSEIILPEIFFKIISEAYCSS